jgi:hypothetical protein
MMSPRVVTGLSSDAHSNPFSIGGASTTILTPS